MSTNRSECFDLAMVGIENRNPNAVPSTPGLKFKKKTPNATNNILRFTRRPLISFSLFSTCEFAKPEDECCVLEKGNCLLV